MSKYNRTPHIFWSEGATNDDKIIDKIDQLFDAPLILTSKLDGSNCQISRDNIFARTHAHAPTHPSFDWIKREHQNIKHLIPSNLQIFGENLYAKHSIAYYDLPSYFFIFNIRDTQNQMWLSWEEVKQWANKLGFPTVPILAENMIVKNENQLQTLTNDLMKLPSQYSSEVEGLVIRLADQFSDDQFSKFVCKMVRKDHIQTDAIHWSKQSIVKNKLK